MSLPCNSLDWRGGVQGQPQIHTRALYSLRSPAMEYSGADLIIAFAGFFVDRGRKSRHRLQKENN